MAAMISTISAYLYAVEDEGDDWLGAPDEYDALALPDLDENCEPLPYERHVESTREG